MTNDLVPLAELLAGRDRGSDTVALHNGRPRSWSELAASVAGLKGRLAERSRGRWAVFTDDAWTFAVALLGIWHAGGVAVIPPNGQPGTLAAFAGNVDGLVTDRTPGIGGLRVVPALGAGDPPGPWASLDPDVPRLALYTSGTTGDREVEVKTIGHIDREIAAHERRWGGLVAGAHALATVSHQHIYGLLFRVAWPLAAGRVFHGDTLLQPADVVAVMHAVPAAYLVTTPTYLRRLKDAPALEALRDRCRLVFSSGGPLESTTAEAMTARLGVGPIEVFGSTETGGVAWRQHGSGHFPAWTPFEGVTVQAVRSDSRLQVRSPYVSRAGGETVMGDQVEILDDGRFLLGPRADRLVKIGERRLVLSEMEGRMRRHPYVETVGLVVLPQRGGPRVGAVVVATDEGRKALERDGRRGVVRELMRWLEPHWDRVLLPRGWRFVDRLPEDAQGKIPVAALRALFAPVSGALSAAEIVSESIETDRCRQTLRVPETLGCLAGHFPAMPVVPGFVQLQWAIEAAGRLAGTEVVPRRMEAVKFREMVRPGDVVELTVERLSGEDVRFAFVRQGVTVSSGRLLSGDAIGPG